MALRSGWRPSPKLTLRSYPASHRVASAGIFCVSCAEVFKYPQVIQLPRPPDASCQVCVTLSVAVFSSLYTSEAPSAGGPSYMVTLASSFVKPL